MGQFFSKIFQHNTKIEGILQHPKKSFEYAADSLEKKIDNNIESKITSPIEKEIFEDGVHISKELVVEKVESYLPTELLGNPTPPPSRWQTTTFPQTQQSTLTDTTEERASNSKT